MWEEFFFFFFLTLLLISLLCLTLLKVLLKEQQHVYSVSLKSVSSNGEARGGGFEKRLQIYILIIP